MILELRLKNFYSLRDEQVLDMQAADIMSAAARALAGNVMIWATQEAIATLFDKGRSTITEHLKNIFETGELDQNSVCRKFRRTAADGKNYETQFYNLDAIISVGYRVNSRRATV